MDLSFSQKIRFSIIVAGLLPWLLFSALMLHYRNGPAERLETQLTLIWQQLNQQLDYMLNSSMAAAHLDTPLPPMISGYWETRQGHWQGSGIAPPIQEYQCDDPPLFATLSAKPEQLKLFACQRQGNTLRLFIFDMPALLRQLTGKAYKVRLFFPLEERLITLNSVNSRLILLPSNKNAGVDTAIFARPQGYLADHFRGQYWGQTLFGWTLYLSSPLPPPQPSRGQISLFVSLTLGLILLQGWVISLLLSRRLNYLGHAFARIALGDTHFRLPPGGQGEFHQLNLGFNHMLDYLQQQQQQAVVARQNADEKVARLEQTLSQIQQIHNQLFQKAKLTSVTTELAALWSELSPPLQQLRRVLNELDHQQQQIQEHLNKSSLDRRQIRQLSIQCGNQLAQGLTTLEQAWHLVSSRVDGVADACMCEQQDLNLFDFLSTLQQTFAMQLAAGGHQLYIRAPHDLTLHGSTQALQSIFANLINNSLAYAFAPGTPGAIIISCKPVDSDEILIQYRDNGLGIPNPIQEHLFEPFGPSRDIQHTSLGLYLVHELVTQLLGGRIACNSLPDSGTEFLIWLPRQAH